MMKRLISLILSLILVVAAAVSPACAEEPVPAEKLTRIEKAVAEGRDKALWELVNSRYAAHRYVEEGCADVLVWSPESPMFAISDWKNEQAMHYYWIHFLNDTAVGFSLDKVLSYTLQADGTYKARNISRELFESGTAYIAPGYECSIRRIRPANEINRSEIIVAAGTDDNGHELEFYGVIQMLNGLSGESDGFVPVNPEYDVDNLRHDAEYQMIVADGVWWVPASSLGKSRYTNREIAGMLDHTPEQKQEEISTLYEAIQLFKISGFTYSEDNAKVQEDGINWEHHKPGYDAVRTNTGCCAADSNWLNYILDGDYEQIGFLAYSRVNGSGHILNYIFQDGYYYFIDLMSYEEEALTEMACENGMLRDFENSGTGAGCLFKARSPEDFVKYYADVHVDALNLFFFYQAENCVPLSGEMVDGVKTMLYPEEYDVRVIEGRNPGKISVKFVPGPKKTYDWSVWKNAKIQAKDRYLRTAEESAAEPLTSYKPGDVLTLEDQSDKGQAVIDGIKYATSKRDKVRITFEDNLYLEGRHVNGVYDLSLSPAQHGDALKEMDSLVLGELSISIDKSIPETQVVICIREGDQLVVWDVLDGKYYDLRQTSIRKDGNGSWQAPPEYWFLVISKVKELKYEFGMFRCEIQE